MIDPDTFLTTGYVMVDELMSQVPQPMPRHH